MEIRDEQLIISDSVYYAALIKDVRINDSLQPFWELFTNSLEAIVDNPDKSDKGLIVVRFYYYKDLLDQNKFAKLEIEDSGIGFNKDEFERFLRYKDDRKGHNNQGSGRLQVVAAFNTAEYESTFKQDGIFYERKFHLSGRPNYLKANGIVFHEKSTPSAREKSGTTVRLQNVKVPKVAEALNIDLITLKERIITHYISYFCANRDTLPSIEIEGIANGEIFEKLSIESADIPPVDKQFPMPIQYELYDFNDKAFLKKDKVEEFTVKAFRIPAGRLSSNAIYLTSKDQLVDNEKRRPELKVLAEQDKIGNSRFLFLISGSYIDERDQDNRGEINIFRKDEILRNLIAVNEEQIFLDEMEQEVNDVITREYEEIQQKAFEKAENVQELKKMFLLNDEFLSKVAISVNDTEERVLEKVYTLESKQMAKGDAKIKRQVDKLKDLDPSAANYQQDMKALVYDLVKEIPHRNRAALTHYVARRKLVLDIYHKVLNSQLGIQLEKGRKKDESLIHNLIFRQKSNDPLTSDLWLISEDYIYFKGSSEDKLLNLEIDGKRVFREALTEEEGAFVNKYDLNKLNRRTDVLLFPQEGKCIIIEFKAPDVNVGDHLTRVSNYASLILNFAKPEFPIDTFYGYLVGENIDPDEVRSSDSDFKFAPHFDFLYRPYKSVFAKFVPKDGDLYMEVIRYSTLWERAKKRNEIFIDLLFKDIPQDDQMTAPDRES